MSLPATLFLSHTPVLQGIASLLPSSKSISNRVLILNALSGNPSVLNNLSSARDTQLMRSLIDTPDSIVDVKDAGTTMRFLTAYFGLTGKTKTLTGTERMKQRPIALLVNALRQIGVTLEYLETDGFPPLQTKGFRNQKASSISIPGEVSSQYISALMMVAPLLPLGLTLQLEGKISSRPYIDMTASLMREFGVTPVFSGNTIEIPHQLYQPTTITVEADWSAASYWFAFTALAGSAEISLPNVSRASLQGDRAIVAIMEKLGVKASFALDKVTLSKQPAVNSLAWDFTDCPDLAQTVLPVCAAKGVAGSFTGLESLRIKETDRIAALQRELAKIGASFWEENTGHWKLTPGRLHDPLTIQTYHDHRMAMGFAPWATLIDLTIEDPAVVDKSYDGFWADMKAVGFKIS